MSGDTKGNWEAVSRSRWTWVGMVAALIAGWLVLVTPAPAAIAAPTAPKTQSDMGKWSDGEFWRTSWGWARVRDRVGFEWTTQEPYQVRAISEVQADWPTSCTGSASVTVGREPSATIGADGCTPDLFTKLPKLELKNLTIPMRWSGPQGSGNRTCQLGRLATKPTDFQRTWSCRGDWMTQQDYFRYRAATSTITADVADDGQGLKDLGGRSQSLTFYQPDKGPQN